MTHPSFVPENFDVPPAMEEDLADLERHQQEFLDRKAFAYAVVSPDEERVLGCVYINPAESDEADARVHMWVRHSEYNRGLAAVLLSAARDWMDSSWPFKVVIYPGREQPQAGPDAESLGDRR